MNVVSLLNLLQGLLFAVGVFHDGILGRELFKQ